MLVKAPLLTIGIPAYERMVVKAPLLTIIIPTYERCHHLRRALDALAVALSNAESKDDVEIVISDNGSQDETPQVVASYCETLPVIYYWFDENVGLDRNLSNLVRQSRGEFIFLLGDDDLIRSNFFQKIIPVLR